jgi:hypothetical protein
MTHAGWDPALNPDQDLIWTRPASKYLLSPSCMTVDQENRACKQGDSCKQGPKYPILDTSPVSRNQDSRKTGISTEYPKITIFHIFPYFTLFTTNTISHIFTIFHIFQKSPFFTFFTKVPKITIFTKTAKMPKMQKTADLLKWAKMADLEKTQN